MKRAQYHAWGGNDVIQIEDVNIPSIQDQEVLIQVHAAGVNPIDWKVREGHYSDFIENPFPFPMGWDFSGTIIELGNSVSKFKKNDDVYGLIRFFEPAGCFAEYVSAPADQIALKASNMDHEHSAGVPLVALTAWQGLFESGHLQPKQKVLIHAAAGAVGQMAIQLAKWKGAQVIALGSDAGKSIIQDLGADQFINYQADNFDKVVDNVDLVLDFVGQDKTLRSINVIKPGGRLISFTQPISQEVEEAAKAKDISAEFIIVQPSGSQLQQITKLIEDNVLQIRIEQSFPLNQVKDALALQETGHCHGKVIITPMH